MEEINLLIQRARGREVGRAERHAAFGQLVEQFQTRVYTFAYAVLKDAQLAQDVTQETLICAYQHLDQLREPAAFPVWLLRLARTQCNRLQRKRHLAVDAPACWEGAPSDEDDPVTLCEQADVRTQVLAAIAQLPEGERIVVELFYLQELSLKEIAERLALPITTLKKRLQYGRGRLRQHMQTLYGTSLFSLFTLWNEVMQQVSTLGRILCPPVPVLVPVGVYARSDRTRGCCHG